MARMQKTIEAARLFLAQYGIQLGGIGGPFSPAAMSLWAIAEGGRRKRVIPQEDFWEVGWSCRECDYVTGEPTRSHNVDPFDTLSNLYAAEAAVWDDLQAWQTWARDNGFEPLQIDEVRATYCVGWLNYAIGNHLARHVILAGRHARPMSSTDMVDCLLAALNLDDTAFPHIGKQRPHDVRERIRQCYDLAVDAALVGPVPDLVPQGGPFRIPEIKPWPAWTGPNGLRAQLAAIAAPRPA